MTMQEILMEAVASQFNIVPKYYNALPRPTYEENQALDLKLIQRGQQVPIIVNRDMDILDGYTRYDLLMQRGKKIKYSIMDFEDKQAEYEFVVETNIMKRQLNSFQRVEAMYEFYIQTKLEKRLINREAHFDIFRALKEGAVTTKDVMRLTKYSKKTIHRLTEELSVAGYIRKTKEKIVHNKGETNGSGNIAFMFKLLPLGESVLSKEKPRTLGASIDILGEIIGVKIGSVRNAVNVIKSGNKELIEKCRRGEISLTMASGIVYGTTKVSMKGKSHMVWKPYSKIKCPSCAGIHEKKEYTLVR